MADNTITLLINQLSCSDRWDRIRAIRELARLGDARAVDPLSELLKETPESFQADMLGVVHDVFYPDPHFTGQNPGYYDRDYGGTFLNLLARNKEHPNSTPPVAFAGKLGMSDDRAVTSEWTEAIRQRHDKEAGSRPGPRAF